MIPSAFAQTTGTPELATSNWDTPSLWVAISFVLFVTILARPMWKFVISSMDRKIEEIKTKIEEATILREEAQDMLAANKRKVANAEKEAGEILAKAREEAQLIKTRLAAEMEELLERRQQMASDRISQAEAEAIEAVRLMTVDIALNATEQLLSENLRGEQGKRLIDHAIKELPDKLN